MGYYTSVIHPVNGTDIQIYTGDDDYKRFHLGDSVGDKGIDKNEYGSGAYFDGIYYSYGEYSKEEDKFYERYYVLIQDGIIKDIFSILLNKIYGSDGQRTYDEERYWDIYHRLREIYPKIIPYNEYTLKERVRHKVSCIKSKLRSYYGKVVRKITWIYLFSRYGKTKANGILLRRFASSLANPLRHKLDYVGIARKFIQVEPFPEGQPIIFDN